MVCLCAVALLLPGCMPDKSQLDLLKWQLNLDPKNKLPYGTYLAWHSLDLFFPEAKKELLPRAFRYSSMDNEMLYNYEGRSLLILHGLDFYLNSDEWKNLKEFVRAGNEVMLFCSRLDNKLQRELKCYKELTAIEENVFYNEAKKKENRRVLAVNNEPAKYGYEGRSLMGYFSAGDADEREASDSTNAFGAAADTLGYVEPEADFMRYKRGSGRQADFVRYKLGEGHLTLHAAPLVLSNYFLLQDGNEHYLNAIWHTLPAGINHIYWNDYYKRREESAGLSILFRYPATRFALWLAIIAVLVYVLFEGKRKQRIVPIIPPLKNDSVSFVETVGRLYYNKGNHSNLAHKMVQQYLEWVRSHYFLNTNMLNEQFANQLAMKSGQPETTVRGLMDLIHEIRLGTAYIDDAYLYQLYNTIQLFYKNNHR